MRVLTVATFLGWALAGASVVAQPPAAVSAAGQPANTQAPATPAPAQAAQPPFPEGAKFAYVNIQRVAAESSEGMAANARVQALSQQKLAGLEQQSQQLQSTQEKLAQSRTVLSSEARLQLQREIDKLTLDTQRATQDAEVEVQALQQQLQIEFQQKLVPVIEEVASEKQLQFIFSAGDSGLVWADASLDITQDVIEKLDAGATP